jgi:GNAT superfamily N-acetyltransferase
VAVRSESLDLYVDAFVARCRRARRPGQMLVNERGVHGLLADAAGYPVRLLVTDDRALDLVAAQLARAPSGKANVLDAAVRCGGLLRNHPIWGTSATDRVTLMVARDLSAVRGGALPTGVALSEIRRLEGDAPGLVPLEEAVALVMRADSGIGIPQRALVQELRSLPGAVRLLAAVDEGGEVRATSGSGVFGTHADVLFVNTGPGWRGRGIGAAMTAAALQDAMVRGARVALRSCPRSIGQLAGPLTAGALAQATGLRAGPLILPALTVLAASGRCAHCQRRGRRTVLRPGSRARASGIGKNACDLSRQCAP